MRTVVITSAGLLQKNEESRSDTLVENVVPVLVSLVHILYRRVVD